MARLPAENAFPFLFDRIQRNAPDRRLRLVLDGLFGLRGAVPVRQDKPPLGPVQQVLELLQGIRTGYMLIPVCQGLLYIDCWISSSRSLI
jgi:hypothetical protein